MFGGDGIGIKNIQLALARWTEPAFNVGIATGGGNTAVEDTHKNWTVNKWAGGLIYVIKADGKEYTRDIISNTATEITFAALPGGVNVVAGDIYAVRIYAAEQVAPGAGTALVTQAVTAAKSGYIYGFFISCQEANDFLLNWTSGGAAKSKRIVFGGAGVVQDVEPAALNEGLAADGGTNITITNVNAGGAGKVYQANLLYAEV